MNELIQKVKTFYHNRKKLAIFLSVLSVLIVGFWTIAWTNPVQWFNLQEWNEHLKQFHGM